LARNEIITGIDLGSSKVCCLVAEINESGNMDILGYGISPSSYLKKGNVVNIEGLTRSINDAVNQAETMANLKIEEAVVGLSLMNVDILRNKGVVAIPKSTSEITNQDVERVIQAAKILAISPDRDVVQVIPREFIVDGCEGINDPVGMVGTRLEVDSYIVTAPITVMQNIHKCFQRAGILINNIYLKPFAVKKILLSWDEIEMGVALIDVGATITEIAVFKGNDIVKYATLPVGGDYITNDIAVGLRLPFNYAEIVKRRYACAQESLASEKQEIEIQSIGEVSTRRINQKELASIIEPRVHEIISLIRKELEFDNQKINLAAGGVITGSGLLPIKGTLDLAQKILGMPLRGGKTEMYGYDQTFTVCLGLLSSVISSINFNRKIIEKQKQRVSFLERAKRFLREYF